MKYCYVPIIFEDYIRLAGNLGSIKTRLAESPYAGDLGKDPYQKSAVALHFTGQYSLNNRAFVNRLKWLNEQGVCFGEDYKQGMDPAGIMAELQTRGLLKQAFRTIAWGSGHLPIIRTVEY